MTQEEKQLLLKDLCARLPYGIKVKNPLNDTVYHLKEYMYYLPSALVTNFEPYLRPISSMTEEETIEWNEITLEQRWVTFDNVERCVDWLNAHHFDYRGLIEKGLALEAPEGMYKDK